MNELSGPRIRHAHAEVFKLELSHFSEAYDGRRLDTALEVTDSSLSLTKWELARSIRHFQIENGDWRCVTTVDKPKMAAASWFWQLETRKRLRKFRNGSWLNGNGGRDSEYGS